MAPGPFDQVSPKAVNSIVITLKLKFSMPWSWIDEQFIHTNIVRSRPKTKYHFGPLKIKVGFQGCMN